jgi:SagB-type dehydrogenase family enzyme
MRAVRDTTVAGTVSLPPPRATSEVCIERCLLERRSVRGYRPVPLTLSEVGQLLWAAQGISAEGYLRTAPSAGALYPLEIYLVAAKVDGIPPGVYHYRPDRHDLAMAKPGDLRRELAVAAFDQECVRDAPAIILFSAAPARTTRKYGERGLRYVLIEVGHAAENAWLQATALGLGAVTAGAFNEDHVKRIAQLPGAYEALYLMPVGRK